MMRGHGIEPRGGAGRISEEVLRNVPFFRNLPRATLDAVAGRLQPVTYARGATIFHRGARGDSMFFVQSGQVEACIDGCAKPLALLGPGGFVGEIALLLHEPRSATVRVTQDAELLELRREDLDGLLRHHPWLAVELSRELGRRLVATNLRMATPLITQCVAVVGTGLGELAEALAVDEPGRIGVLALPGATSPSTIPVGVVDRSADAIDAQTLTAYSRTRAAGCDRLLLGLSTEASPIAAAALAVAEYVVAFGPCPDWVRREARKGRVLRCDGSAPSLERVARWIRGQAIGLVLSSGGSKTVAHIGVIRVLREMGITVDAIAGASGGAAIAAAFACGLNEREMVDRVHALARCLQFRRFDFNLMPRTALSKGLRLRALLNTLYAGRCFVDTEIPLCLVAADLDTGKEVLIDTGSLADGVRASLSMPVFFDPWPRDDLLLIDGAVVNPLPASVLRSAGVSFVIGSNVAGQDMTLRRSGDTRRPNAIQTVARMMNSMEREMLKTQVPLVDLMIRPVVSAGYSFDFSGVDRLIAEGDRAARARLADARLPAGAARPAAASRAVASSSFR